MEEWQNGLKNKRVVFFVAETISAVARMGLNAFGFSSAFVKTGCKTSIVCYNYNNILKNGYIVVSHNSLIASERL